MKLNIRHRFDCTPAAFWEMFWDDDFDAELSKGSDVKRELLSTRDEGSVNIRRVRFTPNKELPRAIAKLIGAKKLVYEQENCWDRDRSVMTWEVVPSFLPGKLSAKGTFEIRETPTGCEQVVLGDIDVKVRFIGGQIEKTVVEEVVKSYDRTASKCRQWLAR